ncbi:MAG: hypothetical protein LBK99_12390, partial [Opitutaceae bacterium]|nr:hypothetical protein [Opitutaceae bacterium]
MKQAIPILTPVVSLLPGFALILSSAFATPDTPPLRNDRMGVATHLGRKEWDFERAVPLIADLGVGWIRDEVYWNSCEKTPAAYALPETSRLWIDTAHQAGLKIILVFNIGREGNKAAYPHSPFDPDAYARAAAHLAREMAGKVQVIEILNEPNNFGFMQYHGGAWNGWDGKGAESSWIAKYVGLFNKAAVAIKQASPATKVIGLGAPAPANFRMLARGIAPKVDGMVDHPYSFRTVPEVIPFASSEGIMKRDGIATADARGSFASHIRLYREHSVRHKGPRELWLTEWGFPIHQEAENKKSMYAGRTPEAQAKYALRRFAECLALGVEVSVYYDFKDDGRDPREAEHNFGLMTFDWQPKPAYHAVQRLARFMMPWRAAAHPPGINALIANTRPDQWPVIWDGSRLAAPGTVVTYAFENASSDSADKDSLMILRWSAERIGDLQPRLGELEIAWPAERATPSSIRQYDLWTGGWSDAKFGRKPDRLYFPEISFPDAPV